MDGWQSDWWLVVGPLLQAREESDSPHGGQKRISGALNSGLEVVQGGGLTKWWTHREC